MPLNNLASKRAAVVIPARWGSTRFPGKPLHLIAGKPLVQHVWERCVLCPDVDRADVVIATDDERIEQAASEFGAQVRMTSPDHPSGTDRIAEVASMFPEWNLLINVQGDEPLMNPLLISQLIAALAADESADIVTAASPIEDPEHFENPNIVKVVTDLHGRALYFSRSLIPYPRNPATSPAVLRHMGVYGYRSSFLRDFVGWQPTPLEMTESLEQLRALEHGGRIQVLVTDEISPGVDTPEQAREVEELIFKTRVAQPPAPIFS